MSRWKILIAIVLTLALTSPLLAYTIYLKDGSSIAIKGTYEERDGNAYFVYPNGNSGFLPMDLIDVEKTKTRNEKDIGGAAVIQESEIIEETAPPAPKQRTLSDLIRERKQTSQSAAPAGNDETPPPEAAPSLETGVRELDKTSAGYPDLTSLERIQLRDLDLAAEILKAFTSQSVDGVRIYQGSRSSTPLVTVTANSEGTVLRAIAVAAKALGQVREQNPDVVQSFELLISTAAGQRAGQFLISPEDAQALLSGDVEPTAFYVANVQF